MGEELYLRYEMKYMGHMLDKIAEARKQQTYETAKELLSVGYNVDELAKCLKISREEVLALRDELERDYRNCRIGRH